MAFCFVFFLVFNFGMDTFKSNRGLASNQDTQLDKDTSKVIVKNMSAAVEGKKIEHSAKPSPGEQFLYGYLQGKYKAVYKNNKFSSIELKKNHQPLEFSKNRRQELMRNVQALFIAPGTSLENMKSSREPASTSLTYEMRLKGDLKGLFTMTFSSENELQAIELSELTH